MTSSPSSTGRSPDAVGVGPEGRVAAQHRALERGRPSRRVGAGARERERLTQAAELTTIWTASTSRTPGPLTGPRDIATGDRLSVASKPAKACSGRLCESC